ncbi:hypothetical protein SLEP1_g5698 [Rubroshorea leprosula]|uniref:SOSEKI DIX-like domain-containing protein n=1 Tax=Rubroshorea leprosula TaxID=152421 RepID=A0AAV5I1L4_9ROSI|nr:hypothetical protein SLEP1_g5698 [Rubroshorea leprosula]
MAANPGDGAGSLMPKKHQDTQKKQKVPVVYYLSRNGQLEHPHFMDVPLSSPDGLYLRDFINRLNSLRGKGMANKYSWSSKRSYKNGFVWQDLTENDFIYPSHGHDYILKGSQLLKTSLSLRSYETVSSTSSISISKFSSETNNSSSDSNFPSLIRKKNYSWSTFDIDADKHRVYTAKTSGEFSGNAMNASTQTDDNSHRKVGSEEDGQGGAEIGDRTAENDRPSGRIRASAVLMQLIACGSRSIKDSETAEQED